MRSVKNGECRKCIVYRKCEIKLMWPENEECRKCGVYAGNTECGKCGVLNNGIL